MEGLVHNITVNQFKDIFTDAPSVSMDDNFHIMEVSLTNRIKPLAHPCRFDCFMAIFCMEGHLRLSMNLQEYELKKGMLFLSYQGNIIRINEMIDLNDSGFRYLCVLMSRSFLSNLRLDVNKIITGSQAFVDNPTISLDDNQKMILKEHMMLMMDIVKHASSFKAEAVRSILSSVVYYLSGVWPDKSNAVSTDEKPTTRGKVLADRFVNLVSEYFAQYRNVGFYADKLCMTPKYLSRVVREVTGRSAPEWIDSYVILEAKNLLKYSGLPIKEVVFKLNFPNQSVFYKFFKARTGMTPSEYRNS